MKTRQHTFTSQIRCRLTIVLATWLSFLPTVAAQLDMAVNPQITAASAKPPQRLARMGSTHLRHAGRIFEIAFSTDNKVMATAGQTGVIRLWNVKTGRLVREIHNVESAVFGENRGPFGKRIEHMLAEAGG